MNGRFEGRAEDCRDLAHRSSPCCLERRTVRRLQLLAGRIGREAGGRAAPEREPGRVRCPRAILGRICPSVSRLLIHAKRGALTPPGDYWRGEETGATVISSC